MTPNRQKDKGSRWERDLVKLLEEKNKDILVKKIAGSGALGTNLQEPLLMGDVRATFPGLTRSILFECKTGYGGSKQLTVKKEWFDKIKEEAEATFSLPAVVCKFSGARKSDGVQYFVSLDFDTFMFLMERIRHLDEELSGMYEEFTYVPRPLE